MTDFRVAIRRRYEISDAMKDRMLETVMKVMESPESSPRERVAAAKVLIAAEQQNQTDERHLDDNARILELAERLGIRGEVEQAHKERADSVVGLIDAEVRPQV